jgi:SSS family transporter
MLLKKLDDRAWIWKHSAMLLLAVLAAVPIHARAADFLSWNELTELPPNPGQVEQPGVAGPFVGVHNDHLIVAGGANFPEPVWENDKVWHPFVWAYDLQDGHWAGQISTLENDGVEYRVAYGASASTSRGVACLGGNDGEMVFGNAFLLRFENGAVVQKPLPDLPGPLCYSSATAVGDVVYVAGGTIGLQLETAACVFWMLDLGRENPEWESLPWPKAIPERAFHMLVAQKNAAHDCLYIIGGRRNDPDAEGGVEFLTDVWEHNLVTGAWRRCSDLPEPRAAGVAAPLGESHIFVIGGDTGKNFFQAEQLKDEHPGFVKRTLVYHTITDSWADGGRQPANHVTTPAVVHDNRIIVASGEVRPRVRSPKIWSVTTKTSETSFGVINWITLVVYLAAMIGVGVFFSFRNKSTNDFFRGGQRIPWWVAGLSIFATMLSSITFVALPAKSFATDWKDFIYNMGIVAVAPFIIYFILPFFRRIDATTAYEYLEKRFNVFARAFGSLSFILFQVGRMAIVMYLPALALNAVLPDVDVITIICVMGFLSIIYCSMGGLEAVVWTDAIQAIILLGGGLLSFILLVRGVDGGFGGFVEMANQAHKFTLIKDADLFALGQYSHEVLWVVLVGALANNLIPYTSDQAVVQRYVSTATEKKAAKAIWVNACITIPASLLFFGLGTALFCFYKSNPGLLDPSFKNDAVFPLFIARQLPVGIAGLVVAGIFAAAQSTISTSMNSTSTALVSDFVRRFGLVTDDRKNLFLARVLTVILGTMGTGMAIYFHLSGSTSMWDSFISLIGLIGGPMAGLFLLGIFTRRASGTSAVIAAVVGISLSMYLKFGDVPIHGKLFGGIGIATTVLLGYLLGFVVRGDETKTQGLTIYSLRPDQE